MKESKAWELLAERMFEYTEEKNCIDYLCNAIVRLRRTGEFDFELSNKMFDRHQRYPELLGSGNIPNAWLSFDFDDSDSVGHPKHCFYRQLTALWYALEAKEEGL